MSDAGARLHPCCSRTSSRPPKRSPPPHRASPRSSHCRSCSRAPAQTTSLPSSGFSSRRRVRVASAWAGAASLPSTHSTPVSRHCPSATSMRHSTSWWPPRVQGRRRRAPRFSRTSPPGPRRPSGTSSPGRCSASCAPAHSAACCSTRSRRRRIVPSPPCAVPRCCPAIWARPPCSPSPAPRRSSRPSACRSGARCSRCSPRQPPPRPLRSRSRAAPQSNTSSTERASRCTAAATT